MGNCMRLLRRESSSSSSSSSMVWADDGGDDEYWDSSVAKKKRIPEKQGLLDDHINGAFSSSLSSSTTSVHSSSIHNKEIKIKITKKQLEKLLGEVDMPVDQVLSRLINASSSHQQISPIIDQHNGFQSWRPRLQSIPEVD